MPARPRKQTPTPTPKASTGQRGPSVARVSEISATSPRSFDAAVKAGIQRANETLRHVSSVWVKEQRVKSVFGEAGFSERTIAQLAADTGASFVGDLYTDTLSAQSPTNTYVGAMEYNADTIVGALR